VERVGWAVWDIAWVAWVTVVMAGKPFKRGGD
jgi:hypothetical protein